MDEKQAEALERDITSALETVIGYLAEEPLAPLCAIQPPTSVIRAAAVAAAQVMMAFELGYQMTSE